MQFKYWHTGSEFDNAISTFDVFFSFSEDISETIKYFRISGILDCINSGHIAYGNIFYFLLNDNKTSTLLSEILNESEDLYHAEQLFYERFDCFITVSKLV